MDKYRVSLDAGEQVALEHLVTVGKGALVTNVAGWADRDLWDVKDQELLAAARLHVSQLTPSESVAGSRSGG